MSRGSFVVALSRSKVFRFLRNRRQQYLSRPRKFFASPLFSHLSDRFTTERQRVQRHARPTSRSQLSSPGDLSWKQYAWCYAVINERQRYDRYRSTKINPSPRVFSRTALRSKVKEQTEETRQRVLPRVVHRASESTGKRIRRVERFSLFFEAIGKPSRRTASYMHAYTLRLVYAFFNKFIREIATLPRRVNRSACFLIARVAAFHRSSSTRERCRASTKLR